MKFLTLVRQQPKPVLMLEGGLLVLLAGTIDWLSGYEMSMSLFYGVPIMAVIWLCGAKEGLLIALLCGITWWWADILAGHVYPRLWLAIWEPTVRFGYFGFLAIGGAALKDKHDAIRTRIALLEHSQRLEGEIIEISEREQRRIGRDLHDGLCQYFAAIGCGVASLRADLLQRQLPNEAAVAEELAGLLNDGVVQARDLARGLVPVHMEEAGLSVALDELANSMSRLLNLDCAFESDGDAAIDTPCAATHLYRIAQEAINNASRHGRATTIRIRLFTDGQSATLTVADNGLGLSQTSADPAGLGLNIMSYRARLIGGTLAISESPAGGTAITCTFPQQRWHKAPQSKAA